MRQVVITGVGAVSALGCEHHFERLQAGDCGATSITNPEYRSLAPLFECAIELPDRKFVKTRMLRKVLSNAALAAVRGTGVALEQAKLHNDPERLAAAGLYVGSVCMEATADMLGPAVRDSAGADGVFDQRRFGQRGIQLLDPLFLVRSLPNAGAGGIAIEFQLLGPCLNLTNGTVSAMQSVIAATSAIQRGEVDLCVAGGYDCIRQLDSVVEQVISNRACRSQGPADKACRPFDQRHGGYALGEGAAFLVLEEREAALARGARPLATVLGWADRADMRNASASGLEPSGSEGLIDAARAALEAASVGPHQIDLVLGDALAIPDDDRREMDAYRKVLQGRRVPYTGATPAIGFTGAAGAAFSLVHGALALARQVVPPTLNCEMPLDDAPALFARQEKMELKRALVWCSDRGHKSTAVVLGSADGA